MTRTRTAASRPALVARRRIGLPAERAFVIQLRADANLARGIVRGRVEHVLSGTAAHFRSVEELLGCMREIFARRNGAGSRAETASAHAIGEEGE